MHERWQIIGNLGGDPEMRYTADGTPVTNVSIAVTRRWNDRNSGNRREHTTWYRVAAWSRNAEVLAEYTHKGSRVFIEGVPATDENGNPRIWTGQDGQARASYELTAQKIVLLGDSGGQRDAGNQRQGTSRYAAPTSVADNDDAIPF